MIRETTDQGRMIRVVIGREGGTCINAGGVVPDEPENEEDAVTLVLGAPLTLDVVATETLIPPPTR